MNKTRNSIKIQMAMSLIVAITALPVFATEEKPREWRDKVPFVENTSNYIFLNYDERHTSKWQQARFKRLEAEKKRGAPPNVMSPPSIYGNDIHAWVYTSHFAKLFGMPERWVDDSLQGAEALAYRVQWQGGRKCGLPGEQPCLQRVKCVLDVYVDGDVELPWRNDLEVVQDPMRNDHSARWLLPQSDEDRAEFKKLRLSSSLAGAMMLQYAEDGSLKHKQVGVDLIEKRLIAVKLLSTQIGCDVAQPDQQHTLLRKLFIAIHGVSYSQLAQSQQGPSKDTASKDSIRPNIHTVIDIPLSFNERVKSIHKQWIVRKSPYFHQYADDLMPANNSGSNSKNNNMYYDEYQDAFWLPGFQYPNKRYEEVYGEQANQPYDNDALMIWAYTKAFAERYGMSQKNIVGDLGDAMAVVYRIDKETTGICGYFSRSGNCRSVQRCTYDVYFKKEVDIPFPTESPVGNSFSERDDSSKKFLSIQDWSLKQLTDKYITIDHYGNGLRRGAKQYIEAPIFRRRQHARKRKQKKWFKEYYEWSDWEMSTSYIDGLVYWERRFNDMIVVNFNDICFSNLALKDPDFIENKRFRNRHFLFTKRPLSEEKDDAYLRQMGRISETEKILDYAAAIAYFPVQFMRSKQLLAARYHRDEYYQPQSNNVSNNE